MRLLNRSPGPPGPGPGGLLDRETGPVTKSNPVANPSLKRTEHDERGTTSTTVVSHEKIKNSTLRGTEVRRLTVVCVIFSICGVRTM